MVVAAGTACWVAGRVTGAWGDNEVDTVSGCLDLRLQRETDGWGTVLISWWDQRLLISQMPRSFV